MLTTKFIPRLSTRLGKYNKFFNTKNNFFYLYWKVIDLEVNEIADNYDLYLQYSYKITQSNQLKYDMLNEAYLKLDTYFKKYPEKTISKRLIYQTIKSVFIDYIRNNKLILVDIEYYDFVDNDEIAREALADRHRVNEALGEMKFVEREILLRTEENSLRNVARTLQCNHVTIFNRRKEALIKFKEQWQKKHPLKRK